MANQASDAVTRIAELFKTNREPITVESGRAGFALRVHDLFQKNSCLAAEQGIERTGLIHTDRTRRPRRS